MTSTACQTATAATTSAGVGQVLFNTNAVIHYRYRGLRLLIMGEGRMFLVLAAWDPSDSALIVPLDGSVRVQFQFENQPP